jgi:hypothetical protein
VAHPCPAPIPDLDAITERRPMATVVLDTVDVMEIIEVLEYLMERIDDLSGNEHALLDQQDPYDIDDLRADVTRLIDILKVSKLTP